MLVGVVVTWRLIGHVKRSLKRTSNFFFQIPTGIFKFHHHHNHMDASMHVHHHYHCHSATLIRQHIFSPLLPFFLATVTHSSFKFYHDHHLMIFFSLFFSFCSMHFLFKLNFIFSFLFQFSTLFSGLPYDMVFFFFHFFTCLLRFGHTFYLSKKSMLQKKL